MSDRENDPSRNELKTIVYSNDLKMFSIGDAPALIQDIVWGIVGLIHKRKITTSIKINLKDMTESNIVRESAARKGRIFMAQALAQACDAMKSGNFVYEKDGKTVFEECFFFTSIKVGISDAQKAKILNGTASKNMLSEIAAGRHLDLIFDENNDVDFEISFNKETLSRLKVIADRGYSQFNVETHLSLNTPHQKTLYRLLMESRTIGKVEISDQLLQAKLQYSKHYKPNMVVKRILQPFSENKLVQRDLENFTWRRDGERRMWIFEFIPQKQAKMDEDPMFINISRRLAVLFVNRDLQKEFYEAAKFLSDLDKIDNESIIEIEAQESTFREFSEAENYEKAYKAFRKFYHKCCIKWPSVPKEAVVFLEQAMPEFESYFALRSEKNVLEIKTDMLRLTGDLLLALDDQNRLPAASSMKKYLKAAAILKERCGWSIYGKTDLLFIYDICSAADENELLSLINEAAQAGEESEKAPHVSERLKALWQKRNASALLNAQKYTPAVLMNSEAINSEMDSSSEPAQFSQISEPRQKNLPDDGRQNGEQTARLIIRVFNHAARMNYSEDDSKSLKMIERQLKKGIYRIADFTRVIYNKVQEWADPQKSIHIQLRPTTLFSEDNFDRYVREPDNSLKYVADYYLQIEQKQKQRSGILWKNLQLQKRFIKMLSSQGEDRRLSSEFMEALKEMIQRSVQITASKKREYLEKLAEYKNYSRKEEQLFALLLFRKFAFYESCDSELMLWMMQPAVVDEPEENQEEIEKLMQAIEDLSASHKISLSESDKEALAENIRKYSRAAIVSMLIDNLASYEIHFSIELLIRMMKDIGKASGVQNEMELMIQISNYIEDFMKRSI